MWWIRVRDTYSVPRISVQTAGDVMISFDDPVTIRRPMIASQVISAPSSSFGDTFFSLANLA